MAEVETIHTTAPKKRKAPQLHLKSLPFKKFAVVAILLLLASSAGYVLSQTTINALPVANELEEQNRKLLNELNETKLLVSQLEKEERFTYCPTGVVYKDPGRNFKICYPASWKFNPIAGDGFEINPPEGEDAAKITITQTSDDPLKALKRLTTGVFTQSGNDTYEINGLRGYLYTGRINDGGRRALAIVTKGGQTYELVMDVYDDASFASFLDLYKKTIDTFTFLK